MESETDSLEAGFFDRPVGKTGDEAGADAWDSSWTEPDDPYHRTKQSQRAKYVTFAILGMFVPGVAGALAYYKLVMPSPVPLVSQGGSSHERTDLAAPQQLPELAVVVPVPQTPPPDMDAVGSNGHPGDPNESQHEPQAPPEEPQTSLQSPASPLEIAAEPSADEPTPQGQDRANNGVGMASSQSAARAKADQGENKADGPAEADANRGASDQPGPASSMAPCVQASEQEREMLSAEGGNAEKIGKLARRQLAKGDSCAAERLAGLAVESDPTSSLGWIVLGAARYDRRDFKGALEAYRHCAQQAEGRYVQECERLSRKGYP